VFRPAKYLLPARAPRPDLSERLKLSFPVPPQSKTYTYGTSVKNSPTTVALYCPVNDALPMADKRRLQLLGLVLRDRVRVQIRVDQGETYTPVAKFEWSDTYPGFSNLQCRVEVRSDRSQKLTQEIRDLDSKIHTVIHELTALDEQGLIAASVARQVEFCGLMPVLTL